ncbi:MAG: hypothetical protein HC872_06405 [Gammaproteobacteria bacterium]|nr:hypothetical protein [Gammaproteobacteria bacterium]
MRIAASFELVDDFWYLYRLCNIWSPHTAALRSDPGFAELTRRWGFIDYWQRFGSADMCTLTDEGVSCR